MSGPSGSTAYTYTAAGQLATRTTTGVAETFTWDEEGKLASVKKGNKETSFVYDRAAAG
ncbi:hypothetical protein [Kibdelosporangium philippinense]|uniref:hypothetical protein n=1 Tax=Kibdelosporangium philippinense TaxID=211113 RepID=UPI00360B6D12